MHLIVLGIQELAHSAVRMNGQCVYSVYIFLCSGLSL